MRKIWKGDKVKVMRGRAKGSEGLVVQFVKEGQYVIVEGVNLVTKFIKPGVLGNKEGTKIQIEAPIHISNVMVICPKCGEPTRVGITSKDGKKFRQCKKCRALFEGPTGHAPAKEEKKKSKVKKVKEEGKL